MKLAIIGAGNVGGTLGTAWAKKAGHEIFFGIRDPKSDKVQELLRSIGSNARAGTPAEAAASADIIVLTVPWAQAEAAIRSLGDIKGKILIDVINPIAMGPGGPGLEVGHTTSGAEKVQGWAAGASVFKALNTTGAGNMANPVFHGVKSVMFVAGDDDARKKTVLDLVGELGFETIDAGPLRTARLLEPHAMLWIHLALVRGLGRDWAFSIVRR